MNSNPPTDCPLASASEDLPASRCGYIALVGRPNVGKSTLFNAFLGQRLSIVTAKPQTTRSRVLGILTRQHSQLVFLDTPGLLEARYKLHQTMDQQVSLAIRQADLLLLLLDAERPRDRIECVKSLLHNTHTPVLAALNKVDLIPPERLENLLASVAEEYGLPELLPLSAMRDQHVTELVERLESTLPQGPKLYPDEMVAEQPERFFAGELVREAAFNQLADELPYAINVVVDEFRETQPKTYIHATVHVERESQKGIVIGNKGRRLRTIGRTARLALEEFLDAPVFLELWVKVRPDWRNRDSDLKEFGYR